MDDGTGEGARRGRDLAGFYGSDSLSEVHKLALSGAAESEDTEAVLAVMRLRMVDALNKHPGDVHLLLEAVSTLARIAAAEGRMSGKSRNQLAANFQAVLERVGDQLLPKND